MEGEEVLEGGYNRELSRHQDEGHEEDQSVDVVVEGQQPHVVVHNCTASMITRVRPVFSVGVLLLVVGLLTKSCSPISQNSLFYLL